MSPPVAAERAGPGQPLASSRSRSAPAPAPAPDAGPGPADLRLALPALAAWAAAALAPAVPTSWSLAGLGACLAVVALLLVRGRARRAGAGFGQHGERPRAGTALTRGTVVAVALCAAAGALAGALHAADLRRGPLPELARQGADVTVELTVTGDPRLTRPRVRGAQRVPAAIALDAEADRVTGPDGTVTATRTPVLVLVDVPPAAARSRSAWLTLLPSTRLRVRARPVPPLQGAGGARPVAAVLRVTRAGRGPTVTREPSAVQRLAGALRAGLRTATDGLSPDGRALLPGLVIGDTSRMPPELEAAFRATDLTHLTAVSGANFTLLLALLIGPPHLALRTERRGLAPRLGIPLRSTAVLGGLLTVAFTVVCRPDPSVLRAAACGLVALVAIATGRRRSLLPALSTAVLVLVLYDPWLARSYGFLLSVLATASLLTIAPRWSAALRRRRVPPRLAEILAAAAAAQAACAPVVAVLAAHVSLVAVPCNLLAELAVAPATVFGFAALVLSAVAMPLATWAAWLGGWPAGWIAAIARTGAALPGAQVDWPGGWTGGLLLAAVTAVAVLAAPRYLPWLLRRPLLTAVCAAALLVAVVRPVPLPRLVTGWPPPGWRLAVCDVGQGDALVLAAGAGTAVVVDTGPDPALVDSCLRSLAVTRVPLLVLTHFHADHVAGLPGVLRGRAVGAIETTTLDEPPDQVEFVRRVARAAGVPLVRTAPGERRLGPLRWRVLWPPAAAPAPYGDVAAGAPSTAADPALDGANDASVTLLVRTAGLTLLLLGDLEPPAQERLLATVPDLPPVDVLKVAHHGSAYQDPRLLRRVHPRLALISCGADNPYGHPSPLTVAALRRLGAAVLRTDTDGAIAVTGTPDHLAAAVRSGRPAGRRRRLRRRHGRGPRSPPRTRRGAGAKRLRRR